MPTLHPTAQRVAEGLAAAGLDVTVVEHDESSRTAEEAAATAGCELGQIVKSLVFVDDAGPVLVLCAGDRRVDAAGLGLRRAKPDVVREATGFAIGGVPPVGHKTKPVVLIEESLLDFDEIWAAAGTPNAVFRLTPSDLVELTGGRTVAVARK